jgi:hypothetical protein
MWSWSELTLDQKRDILQRWQYGAVELAVASDEGMAGPENGLHSRIWRPYVGLARGSRTRIDPRQGTTSPPGWLFKLIRFPCGQMEAIPMIPDIPRS